jgi:hypothetical protein
MPRPSLASGNPAGLGVWIFIGTGSTVYVREEQTQASSIRYLACETDSFSPSSSADRALAF